MIPALNSLSIVAVGINGFRGPGGSDLPFPYGLVSEPTFCRSGGR